MLNWFRIQVWGAESGSHIHGRKTSNAQFAKCPAFTLSHSRGLCAHCGSSEATFLFLDRDWTAKIRAINPVSLAAVPQSSLSPPLLGGIFAWQRLYSSEKCVEFRGWWASLLVNPEERSRKYCSSQLINRGIYKRKSEPKRHWMLATVTSIIDEFF